jgi:hypothetical protein
MPQMPGFAILISDARTTQMLPVGPVIDQIANNVGTREPLDE